MLASALAYAAAGRAVFPLLPQKKTPRTSDGFKSATTEECRIREWWQKWPDSNLGMATGKASGVVVVDVDGPEGLAWYKANVPTEERARLVQRTGAPQKFHAIYRMPEGCEHGITAGAFSKELDTRGTGGYIVVAPSVHPSGAVYQLMVREAEGEGRKVQPTDGDIWSHLVDLPRVFWETPKKAAPIPQGEAADGEVVEGQRNAACAAKVGAGFARGLGAEDVTAMALAWNLRACRPPLPEAEVRAVVASIASGHVNRHPHAITEDTAPALVATWVAGRSGTFRTQQMDRDLGMRSPADYALRDKALAALLEEGAIRREGRTTDSFRRVSRGDAFIDLTTLPPGEAEVDVALPLDLNRHVIIKPKNIIVVAGESNAGKSALMLNLAWLNRSLGNVRYMTSETSPEELKGRLEAFGPVTEWSGVKFQERNTDFADGIDPNGINVIDFLECVGGEFYKVADYIREVFDALDKGVAFIAIQKKKGAEFGRGAEFSVEKSRLAISLHTVARACDSTIVRAVAMKVKTFRENENIEGRENIFEVIKGRELTSERLLRARVIGADGWRWRGKADLDGFSERVEAYATASQDQKERTAATRRYGDE